MKIGDIVFHEYYGLGVINRINRIGVAEVNFADSSYNAAVENLTTVVENLTKDFSQADSFFETSCVGIISIEDYEKIKPLFLQTLRREAEQQRIKQQELIKQETLRRKAEQQERIKHETLRREAEQQERIKHETLQREAEQ